MGNSLLRREGKYGKREGVWTPAKAGVVKKRCRSGEIETGVVKKEAGVVRERRRVE
jgi:hypothetical protein